MNWKVTRLNTWWTAEQACTVLSFLDELRDQLWHVHGEQITTLRIAELEAQENNENQGQLELDNHIDI